MNPAILLCMTTVGALTKPRFLPATDTGVAAGLLTGKGTVRRALLTGGAALLMASPMQATAGSFAEGLAKATTTPVREPKPVPVVAFEELSLAEQKLAEVLAKSVADKEKSLGFTLEPEDISDIEEILRNKYCGPQGLTSGYVGGACAPSKTVVTCFAKAAPLGEKKPMAAANTLSSFTQTCRQ